MQASQNNDEESLLASPTVWGASKQVSSLDVESRSFPDGMETKNVLDGAKRDVGRGSSAHHEVVRGREDRRPGRKVHLAARRRHDSRPS